MDNDLIEDKLYHIIDYFNERKITNVKFDLILLISLFYDRNGRTSSILFVDEDKIIELIDETKK